VSQLMTLIRQSFLLNNVQLLENLGTFPKQQLDKSLLTMIRNPCP
jgi:hypothetical protein